MKKIDYLKRQCVRSGILTTWHLNDTFLEFCEEYKISDLTKGKRIFAYNCRKLVATGFLNKSVRSGTGSYGVLDFGVNHITTWVLSDKLNRFDLLREYENNPTPGKS